MFAKNLLIVIFSAALVLAVPVKEESGNKDIEEQLENKWNHATDVIKSVWKKIEEEGEKDIITSLKEIKEKTLDLIKEAKDITRQIIIEGKKAKPELKKITDSLEKLAAKVNVKNELVQSTKELLLKTLSLIKEKIAQFHESKN